MQNVLKCQEKQKLTQDLHRALVCVLYYLMEQVIKNKYNSVKWKTDSYNNDEKFS